LVAGVVLQTRAPIGKFCGPDAGLLLSSPTTFQVSGVTLSVASAIAGSHAKEAIAAHANPSAIRRATARARWLVPIETSLVCRALRGVRSLVL
jgi:hypothetical protein